MNIIAFDPGQKGGIAIHHNGTTTAQPMPMAGKTLDLPAIAEIVRSTPPDIAVLEKVSSMPGQGVTSTFTFGMGYDQG
jgi:crossover junction endodeoxyribonuclease RuvC